jgi:K+-transporting ATPase ATPase A chain
VSPRSRVTAVRVTAVPFGILVLGTVLLIGALSFLPVLALGPIAEYLKTAAGG